ncbi:MAG TPA: amidohydrolase family protein [Terriglobales bacterium]|jgi:L-fuconolactonase|nr:amidohydrolase family protein [Terriglobales bacterium]
MRIDAHQHFWRYSAEEYDWIDDSMASLRRDFLPLDLKPELDAAGFDACIAVQARQTLEETRWLLALADENPFIAGVIGWVDLRAESVREQLAELSENPRLVGVRHVVQAEPDDRFLLRPDFLRGIAALQEFDLTYDILIYPRHLPVAVEFVSRFPQQHFVLDHLAKPFIKAQTIEPWASNIRELARFPNVFCKVSGMVTEADWTSWKPEHFQPYLETALQAFGPDRLMIGSDWPVCRVAGSYGKVMSLVIEFLDQHAPDAREKLLGGNAQRAYLRDEAL